MPRNGSGTYTLPAGNPVTSGTVIDSTWANDTLDDLANEITNSLSRTGAGGMLAPFRVADGAVNTPGLSFTNETNTGIYRAGSGELWFTIGGVAVAQITANGLLLPAGKRITVPAPVNGTDATNKTYVDDRVDPVIQYANYYLGPKASDPTLNNSGGALTAGSTYWSTSLSQMRVFNGTIWEPMPATAALVGQTFSGTGAQTNFTLANPSGPAVNLEVFISGVRQVPTTNYTVSGTTLTFVVAPPAGTDNIFVRFAQLLPVGTVNAEDVVYDPATGPQTDVETRLRSYEASGGSALIGYLPSGTGAVATNVQSKLREFVSVKDFGAVGDGVTNDRNAIQAALNSGAKRIYFPAGSYQIGSGLTVSGSDICLFGEGAASRITSSTIRSVLYLGDLSRAEFEGLAFETTVSNATQNVYGVVWSENQSLSDVTFRRCYFAAQNANINAFKAINESTKIAERIAFIGCEFLNVGRMAIEFQNHNDGDLVYRYKRVTVDRCYFKNIGLLGTFGMGVSLSGYGEQCSVTNNSFDNCRDVGIEGVGVRDSLFEGNTFSGFATRSYNPFSFTGSRVMSGLTIRDNKVAETTAGRWNFHTVSNCFVIGNLLRSGFFYLRDANDCLFKDNYVYQRPSDSYSVFIENASARNRFTSNYLDGSLSTVANQGTIFHVGTGVVDTVYEDCRIIKSSVSSAATFGTSVNTRVENCVVDGVLYANYHPFFIRRGILQIASASGVSRLTIAGFNSGSWTTRLIRFSVHGIASDSSGRVAAARQIEVRGQGTNLPEIGGTTTLIESNCTITYTRTASTLTIVCTNSTAANSTHRWEFELIGSPVGDITVST